MKGLLFITHQTERYNYLQTVKMVLEGGCRQIQLRMKDTPADIVQETAGQAKELCDKYQADLYIDDYPEVCKNIHAKGVHLGKSDMSPAEARKILGNDYIIGGTANTFEDIEYLHRQGVDYIGLGPFCYTTTKKNLSPVLGLEGYQRIIKQCRENNICLPIVAIGGITINDILSIIGTGVSCIALSSTILTADNPVEETKRIINLIKEYQS